MPMITVQVATAAPSNDLAHAIAREISELTAKLLGKDPNVTAVAVDFIDAQHWFVGGESSADIGTPTFFVDVRISDGTNTKDEKAKYIAETFQAMHRLLGGSHSESYVHVNDVRADAYGYGGLTQERRYITARLIEPIPA